MDTNRKVFRNSSPALRTELRGIVGGDFNYFPSSLLRFEAKYIEELKPSYIPHRPIETMPSIPGVQLLNEYSVIVSYKLIGNFEVKIPSLISHFLVSFSNQQASFLPTVRTLYPTGEPLLPSSKIVLRLLKEAWVFYLNTIRGGQERLAANIYTYYPASFRQWLSRDIITREGGIPLTRRASADGNCFNIAIYGTREAELEPTYIPDREVLAFQSPASLFEGEAVIPVSTFETRKTGFISILYPAKETLIGFIQSLKRILENLRAYLSVFRKGCPKLRELLNLIKSGNRAMVSPVDSDALLESGIVEVSAEVKPMFGSLKVLWVRLNTIFEGLFHLPCTKVNIAHPEERRQALSGFAVCIPPLKKGVLDSVNL